MNEKTKLLELFEKVRKATDEGKQRNREIEASQRLSQKGKAEEIQQIRQQLRDTINKCREQMLAIVDEREEDYAGYYKKITMDRMRLTGYTQTLTANIELLKKGYLGKIQVMALLELYKNDDVAMDMISATLQEMKSPYRDLLDDRITIRKQMNAFESVRNIIKSKVNIGLLDLPSYHLGDMDSAGFYFGSGYHAILEELNEDLSINSPTATLTSQSNADPKLRIHQYENSGDIISDARNKSRMATKAEQREMAK